MKVAKPIRRLIESFERLPGIGPKTAARLTYYLLHVPEHLVEEFANSLIGIKKDTQLCSICYSIDEQNPCQICADNSRDQSTICVVEQPLDLIAIENTGNYRGLYHVLHGTIAPLQHIGPDEIRIKELIQRIYPQPITEIILALNPTMEGESTALYITQQIRNSKLQTPSLRITRLAQGLPLGGDLEYADSVTLTRALEGRRDI